MCAITETWLKPDDIIHPKEFTPPGYDILSKPRSDGRLGGGVSLVYKSSMKINNITHTDQPTGLEYMNVHVKFRNKNLNLYIIYRYPKSSVLQFTKTLSNILEGNVLSNHGELILTGDFNIHMDKPHLSDTILFNDLLESFNLANKVAFSTHLSQHTNDLMLFETQSIIVSGIRQGHLFSDHYFIHVDLCITTTKPDAKFVSYRKLKNICENDLVEDLRTMSLQGKTIEDLVTSYNSKLSEILDKHAPLRSHRLHPCHSQPWFTDRIKDEIRVRHMKECMWKNNPTEYNLNAFYQQRRHVANIIKLAQLKPTSDCPINNKYIEDGFLTQYHMHEFHEVREEEVLKLLTTSPAKSCELDPFPSKLLENLHLSLKMHLYIPYLRNLEWTASLRTTDQYPTYLFCPN